MRAWRAACFVASQHASHPTPQRGYGRGVTLVCMGDPSVTFDDVEVLRDSGLALLCVIRGKHCWIPKAQLLAGTRVRQPGDRGTIVVPEWFAADQGLI